MSTFGIDGLASGLDTTTIIKQLMQIESAPQTLLKSKQSSAEKVVNALQSVNSKVKSLADAAEKAATASNWKTYSATSSSSVATAAANTSATAGTLSFSVDAVAASQVSLTAAVADGTGLTPDNPPTLTMKKADGSYVSVTAASNSLQDIATAINDSEMGIGATVVQVSSGATPTYRLQFTGEATGATGSFELYAADQATVAGGGATRIDSSTVRAASDASITLWKGSASEQTFTQASNTFSGLMTGVDVTVSQATATGETVTITVAPNSANVKSMASDLVNNLNTVFSDIASLTKPVTITKDDGTTALTGGTLSTDSAVRSLQSALTEAASYPVDGKSPAKYGISINKDGTFTFDEAKFSAALEDDPDGTAEFMQTLSARVQGVADTQSDPISGVFSLKIKSQESYVDQLGRQITDWDDRLETRQAALEATYSALEVTLSGLQAQSSWLSSQLSSLSTSSA